MFELLLADSSTVLRGKIEMGLMIRKRALKVDRQNRY
jgi:hypothetical protein